MILGTSFRLLAVATGLAFLVPILVALYLLHSEGMGQSVDRAQALATEVLRRAELLGDEAIQAEHQIHAEEAGNPCASENLTRLQQIVLASTYLRLIGVMQGDQLVCSTVGIHKEPIDLGPADYISSLGVELRRSVDLGMGTDQRFLVMERDGYAIATAADAPVDLFLDSPELSIGLYGRSSQQWISKRGPLAPIEQGIHRRPDKTTHFNNRFLRVLKHSEKYDITAYAALPATYLTDRLKKSALVLLPLGLLIGAILSLGVFRALRKRTSLPFVMRAALQDREFVVHYQPIINLDSGLIVGAEALLRWPGNGTSNKMQPELFVRVAEDCGLIHHFTRYVLDTVARDAPRIFNDWPDGYLSINLSSSDLHRAGIVEELRQMLDAPGISARNVVVEATEHSLIEASAAENILSDIRALGVRIAMDDFGTGYSCLANLSKLKLDGLKIDRSFVEAIGTDSPTSDVIGHIIALASTLSLTPIAEGVEREEQADFLRQHGVRLAQGWLYAAAMPLAELVARLTAQGESPTR